MDAKQMKKFRIKLMRKEISIREFYMERIYLSGMKDISLGNFNNMLYGSVKMRQTVIDAITKFVGE